MDQRGTYGEKTDDAGSQSTDSNYCSPEIHKNSFALMNAQIICLAWKRREAKISQMGKKLFFVIA
jgi:hypothetical protein